MIDLHCHLLPKVDDGPETLEESIMLAKEAMKQGVTDILCSPHHRNGRYENEKATVIRSVADLQQELVKRRIPLNLLPGQEIRLTAELLTDLEQDKLLFVDPASAYLLIEFPTMSLLSYTQELFFQLRALGKVPIIVHPERNLKFRENPDLLLPYLEMGCLAQLTAPSLVGVYGKAIQKTTKEMLKRNLVQMIASDAHGIHKRTFYLKESCEIIIKDYGTEKMDWMQQVAQDIIRGQQLNYPSYLKKRKYWQFFKYN